MLHYHAIHHHVPLFCTRILFCSLSSAMNHSYFPHNISIQECRAAISGVAGFKETKTNDFICFNYQFLTKDSFPDPNMAKDDRLSFLYKVRRECRGLIFHTSGKLLSRRFHKFFNVNELDETHETKIDLSKPHVIMEKLDGSLVAPVYHNGMLDFATKSGVTDISRYIGEKFIPSAEKRGMKYTELCISWINKNFSPMFEWCSPDHQIVINHKTASLVLIALRDNVSGAYQSYKDIRKEAEKFGIPVVQNFTPGTNSTSDLITFGRKMGSMEGLVLCFEHGPMYKIKSEWYFERHGYSTSLFDFGTRRDKLVWNIIIEDKVDDVLSQIEGREQQKKEIKELSTNVLLAIEKISKQIFSECLDIKAKYPQRKHQVAFIERMDKQHGYKHVLIALTLKDHITPEMCYQEIIQHFKKNMSKTKNLEESRKAFTPQFSFPNTKKQET
eukprot:Phypoly_transcript_09059.p1 GENE.Phypoly_transcript_09059~~Phypoly_transcript_09059.p1  ORF type:complete len:443 (+),score=47.09 Phypoly_transcript_09059:38-1366(+)